MGKWEAVGPTPEKGLWGVYDKDELIACMPKEETANQICMMHNEGVELLKEISLKLGAMSSILKVDRIPDMSELASKSANKIQDLLKRMGVDCES